MSEAVVDLTNCDREPIHVLGAIQPFGFLIAVGADWIVSRVSSNIAGLFGKAPDAVLGAPLVGLFGSEALHRLRNMAAMLRGAESVERAFAIPLTDDVRLYDVALHFSDRWLVIEVEPSHPAASDAASLVRRIMTRVRQVESLQQFLQEGARQIRAVSGFDRVMVYRFDASGSGEVVAEARSSEVDSFLGLHYPASDIPAQARALYLRNTFRLIADIDARPVPIVPQFDAQGAPLDLSLSILRAVSPIHIEYLKNMGVCASMSISIVVEGRLWGLFACHHYQPRLPGFLDRTVAELFGSMFSMMLEARERAATAEYEERGRALSDRVMAVIARDNERLADAEWLASVVADAIPCDGVGVYFDGKITLSGLTPNASQFAGVIAMLNLSAPKQIFVCDSIKALIPEAEAYQSRAAGLMALPISRTPRDYVVLFRGEQLQAVRWAGNPEKPVEYGPNGPRLTPRKSFEEWSSLVRGVATPFTRAELRVADTLRGTLVEVVLKLSEEAALDRQRADERQTLLIAELNHRVRNVLALVRGLLNQARASEGAGRDVLETLGDRVIALARAHDQITGGNGAPASLRGLIETEVAAFLGARKDRCIVEGPDVLLLPDAFTSLALVIHELVTNANKYGALSDNGRVNISWSIAANGRLRIEWRESGGPIVKPPQREGFGSTLIQKLVPHDFGGRADVRFALTGVEVDLELPARYFVVGAAANPSLPQRRAQAEPATRLLDGKVVLLCEDSLLISMDCESLLEELGAVEVLTSASLQQARAALAAKTVDFAILDVNLGSESSLPLAEELARAKTPFAFATGYGEIAAISQRFPHVPVVTKPYTRQDLTEACRKALGGRG
ncbi:MAG: HWE histidine kinase domain-containing protein [Rhodoblastus sp.]